MAKRVVILSDNEKSLATLTRAVTEAGYEVYGHALDEEALVFASRHEPAAIVIDSEQAWGDVAPIISDLRRDLDTQNAALVVSTDLSRQAEILPRLTVHDLHFIKRPIEPGSLIEQLRRAIGPAV